MTQVSCIPATFIVKVSNFGVVKALASAVGAIVSRSELNFATVSVIASATTESTKCEMLFSRMRYCCQAQNRRESVSNDAKLLAFAFALVLLRLNDLQISYYCCKMRLALLASETVRAADAVFK